MDEKIIYLLCFIFKIVSLGNIKKLNFLLQLLILDMFDVLPLSIHKNVLIWVSNKSQIIPSLCFKLLHFFIKN